MVKNKPSSPHKSGAFLLMLLRVAELAVFMLIIGGGLFLWYNPEYMTKFINISYETPDYSYDDSKINSQLEIINNKLSTFENIRNVDDDKFAMLQKQFAYFEKSKADASDLISINNRISNLSSKTARLSQTSNIGALILTSAMLIRDNINLGFGCKKEAEMLKILSSDIDFMKENVENVSIHCNNDIKSDYELKKQLLCIAEKYENEALEKEQQKDWKERLSSKLKEYVKISSDENENYNVLEDIKQLQGFAFRNDWDSVLKFLSDNQKISEYTDIKYWSENVAERQKLYQSLSDLINDCLLIMKVENAKNEQ